MVCIVGFLLSGAISDTLTRRFVAVSFLVGIAAVFIVDGLHARRRSIEGKKLEGPRAEELIDLSKTKGFELKVTGSSGLAYGLFFLIFAALFCLPIYRDVSIVKGTIMAFGGVMMFLFGVHATFWFIPRVNRPVLVLKDGGFETPEFGFVPWLEVTGIDLVAISHKGSVVAHHLVFHVPGLARFRSQFKWYQAVIFGVLPRASKEKVRVLLNKTSEPPGVISTLAHELMERTTGKDYLWRADVSDKENEAYRRVQDSLKKNEELLQRFEESVRKNDMEAVEQVARTATKGRNYLDPEVQAIKSADEGRRRKVNYALMVSMALTFLQALFLVVWLIWKKN
jgi:hypothetical protein